MATKRGLSRRDLLSASIGIAGMGLLSACVPQVPAAAPTPAARPMDTPVPAAPAGSVPTATTAATPAEASKPTAAATPAAAAPKADEKVGRNLIGKLEGPEIITDPARLPKSFKEAPQLAQLVQQGKLPPVGQRVSQDPLVVKPVHAIGTYGGTWRRGFTGPGDYLNGIRAAGGPDFILYVDYTAQTIVPNVARGWEVSPDGKSTTVFLRRGMKWSDGAPFTADDFMFWYEDVYQNKDLNPTPTAAMAINGKPGAIEKVDETTVRFVFPEPYFLLPEVLALNSPISGLASQGFMGLGGYMPKHYLKQYHPRYTPRTELDKLVTEEKFDNWVTYFLKQKADWSRNPDLPVVSPWKTVTPVTTPAWTLERNPYSIWVDTEGNQLPYIDKVQLTLAENLEVLNLRAIAGEYDAQERHTDIGKLPVFLENQQRGGYRLTVSPMTSGSDYGIFFNLHYEADAEVARWFNTRDFRRALSLGIDRDQINEAFFVGIGTPGSQAPAESSKYSPGPEYRTLWSALDVTKANQMLDQIGLDKKDAEGYRVRTDGQGRFSFEVATLGGQFVQYTRISEMIRDQWKKIGIDLKVTEMERLLQNRRAAANEIQALAWSNEGTDALYSYSAWLFPLAGNSWYMPEYGKWFASDGAQGKEPPEAMRRMMALWKQAFGVPEAEQVRLGKEIWKIACEELWYVGVVGQSGAVQGIMVAKQNMGNVPERFANVNLTWPPSIARPVTFYFK